MYCRLRLKFIHYFLYVFLLVLIVTAVSVSIFLLSAIYYTAKFILTILAFSILMFIQYFCDYLCHMALVFYAEQNYYYYTANCMYINLMRNQAETQFSASVPQIRFTHFRSQQVHHCSRIQSVFVPFLHLSSSHLNIDI